MYYENFPGYSRLTISTIMYQGNILFQELYQALYINVLFIPYIGSVLKTNTITQPQKTLLNEKTYSLKNFA